MNFLRAAALTLLFSAGFLVAQAPAGSVTQTTVLTVTAVAPAAASTGQLTCQFSNSQKPTVHVVCSQSGGTVLTMDATPAVGATAGVVGSLNLSGNAITWIVQQPTAGNVTWQVAANGTAGNGTF